MKPSLIVCGESSADRYLSLIVKSIWKTEQLSFIALGGAYLDSIGVELIGNFRSISVIGVLEIVPKLSAIIALYNKLKKIIRSGKVGAVILADFPDFNLRIAKIAKKAGIPVFYYISPQIWAWRKSRKYKIGRLVDELVVVLPFEKALYKNITDNQFRVDYFGHPLIDIIKTKNNPDKSKPVLGIFPGSRDNEIERHLTLFMNSAGIIKKRIGNLKIMIAKAPEIDIKRYGIYKDLLYKPEEIFKNATAALLKSGTITLETAIAGIPGVICYKLSNVSYIAGKLLIKGIGSMGLPNIIMGRNIYPEFIQHLDPQTIANSLMTYFNNSKRETSINDIKKIRNMLGEEGVIDRTAARLYEFIKSSSNDFMKSEV
ncbi:MAG: lipid-A-disaccharide synthase [bacterium]|nr:MAG: lipid-A-disaccharide synthase [bacterium]